MSRETAVFNGIPAWLLCDYLVDLGGAKRGDDGDIEGEGWVARVEAAPRPAGSLGLGRVDVTIEGPSAPDVMAGLRVKARRGGG